MIYGFTVNEFSKKRSFFECVLEYHILFQILKTLKHSLQSWVPPNQQEDEGEISFWHSMIFSLSYQNTFRN